MTSRQITFFIKNPHVTLWIVAAVFLLVGCINFHSSILVADYEKVRGEICNVEEKEVLKKGASVTEYAFDVVWESDGEEYVEHYDGQKEAPEEGSRYIWVRPDNKDSALSSAADIGSEVSGNLAIAMVTGISGFIIYGIRRSGKKESWIEKKERLEDTQMYSMMTAILAFIAAVICGVMSYQDYRETLYFNPLEVDMLVAFALVGIVALIIFFHAGREIKRENIRKMDIRRKI